MLNLLFTAVSLVSFTDTFIALKSIIKVLFLRNLLLAVRLSHKKLIWVSCMLNFTQPAFNTLAALCWPEDLLLDSKNESRFCHINSLQEVAVFSYWAASTCVVAVVSFTHKQFNAFLLLWVMLQNKANKEKNLKEPKVNFYLTAAWQCFLGDITNGSLGVRDRDPG